VVKRKLAFQLFLDCRLRRQHFQNSAQVKIGLYFRYHYAPINPAHLEKLIALALVEMRDDDPVLTNSGLDAIP
jgi:hypothetical protein